MRQLLRAFKVMGKRLKVFLSVMIRVPGPRISNQQSPVPVPAGKVTSFPSLVANRAALISAS